MYNLEAVREIPRAVNPFSYFLHTLNPLKLIYERAEWIPNHFCIGQTGVRFADGNIYSPKYYQLKTRIR